MGTTPTVPGTQGPAMSQVAGVPDLQSYEAYLRDLAARQANTTGLTQVGPNTSGAQGPTQKQYQQPQPQRTQAVGPGQGGAARKQSMQNLVSSVQGVANQIGQAVQAKKQREYQQTVGQYVGAVQGIQQAQAQIQLAQAALKQNPQDPQAQQMLQQAQAALKTNQTNLNDLATNPKHSKVITKAFGIDDKNANSPERQAAIQAMQKQFGVGQQAGNLISRMPQTQQLSPQGEAQQIAHQAGAIGKPVSQDQLLRSGTELAKTNAQEQGKTQRATERQQLQATINGMKYDTNGQLVPMTPQEIQGNPVLASKMGVQQARQGLEQAQAQLAQMRTSAMPEQIKMQEARVAALQGNLMMRQKEFGIKVSEEERKQLETAAKIGEAGTVTTPEGQTLDMSKFTGGRPLQSWAQQTVVTAQDRLQQVNALMKRIEDMGLKDNNTSGYLAMDRLGYAMGHASDAGELGSEISNIELQRVVNAATILKGSSRAYAALQAAMVHTPNAWTDSPKLMYQKLQTIQKNLQDMQTDAIQYGQKNERSTEMPKTDNQSVPKKPVSKPQVLPPASSDDPLGILK